MLHKSILLYEHCVDTYLNFQLFLNTKKTENYFGFSLICKICFGFISFTNFHNSFTKCMFRLWVANHL